MAKPKTKLYRVVYEIDVTASTHRGAAEKAWSILKDPEAFAPIFDVQGPGCAWKRIDLNAGK